MRATRSDSYIQREKRTVGIQKLVTDNLETLATYTKCLISSYMNRACGCDVCTSKPCEWRLKIEMHIMIQKWHIIIL